MKRYDSYKDSGVEWIGEIPSNWELIRGKFVFQNKKEINKENQELNLLSLTLNGVLNKDINSNEGLRPTEYSTYQIFEKNDLVFKLIDLENTQTSRVGLVHERGIMSPVYIRLEPQDKIHSKYSYYYYYDLYKQHIYNFLGSGVRSSLTPSNLLEIELTLPPLPEQQQIVSFLDTKTSLIDSLIEKTQRKIELLKDSIPNYHFYSNEIVQFVEMKEYWFQKKPSDWGILKLRELFDVVSERNHPDERLLSVHQIKGVIYRDEQLQDVMNPSGDISNYKLVKPGDFIISLRSSEGGFEYSEVTGLVSPVYTVLRPKFKIDTIFYKYLFKTHNFIVELNRFIKGIRDGKNINFVDIRDVSVPVPLVFNLKVHQNHLNILKSFLIEEKRIELLKEYRQSLISEVVTGKLKVTTDE